MHFYGKKSSLIGDLSIVEKAAPIRTTIPIINGILVEAKKGELYFTSNNLEMSIKAANRDVEVLEEGSVVLPVKMVDILKQLPDEMVEIKTENDTLRTEILSGKARFYLYGMDPEEYPSFESAFSREGWNKIDFTAGELRDIIKKLVFAVSQDEGKPQFRGVFMKLEEGQLSFLATDTYRLAYLKKEFGDRNGNNVAGRFLIPGKSLNEIMRVLDDSDEGVSCFLNESEMVVNFQQFTFFTRLLEEKFPNLLGVFPGSYQTRIKVNVDFLEKAISRASLLAHGQNQMISLQVAADFLKVKAGSEMGRMEEELLLEGKEGDDLEEILLNARFFLDPLRVINKKTIEIEFNGPFGPCIFNCSENDEPEFYRYLVLPIKVEKKEEE